jgi:hypothetical protein
MMAARPENQVVSGGISRDASASNMRCKYYSRGFTLSCR